MKSDRAKPERERSVVLSKKDWRKIRATEADASQKFMDEFNARIRSESQGRGK